MKRNIIVVLSLIMLLIVVGCGSKDIENNIPVADGTDMPNSTEVVDKDNMKNDTLEETAVSSTVDYKAAIMVDGQIYFLEANSLEEEIDDKSIIGYTTSYTDTFPEKDGETNFNRELEMPYASVDGGIAVLYENEWHLCVLKSN